MFETVLTTIVVTVVSAALAVIGKAVSDWSAREKVKAEQQKQESAKNDALDAIAIGVAKAQQQIVDGAKAAAADGKISKDELKTELQKAEELAKQTAMEIATGPAIEWLEQLTQRATGGLIDFILQDRKQQQVDVMENVN